MQYEPGGAANAADYLSRHTKPVVNEVNNLEVETENYVQSIVNMSLPTALTTREIQQAM